MKGTDEEKWLKLTISTPRCINLFKLSVNKLLENKVKAVK